MLDYLSWKLWNTHDDEKKTKGTRQEMRHAPQHPLKNKTENILVSSPKPPSPPPFLKDSNVFWCFFFSFSLSHVLLFAFHIGQNTHKHTRYDNETFSGVSIVFLFSNSNVNSLSLSLSRSHCLSLLFCFLFWFSASLLCFTNPSCLSPFLLLLPFSYFECLCSAILLLYGSNLMKNSPTEYSLTGRIFTILSCQTDERKRKGEGLGFWLDRNLRAPKRRLQLSSPLLLAILAFFLSYFLSYFLFLSFTSYLSNNFTWIVWTNRLNWNIGLNIHTICWCDILIRDTQKRTEKESSFVWKFYRFFL